MDPARCDPQLAAQLAELREIYGNPTNIVVIDLEGRIICGATPPPKGMVVRTADAEMLPAMIARPRFRLSKPIIDTISKRWTLAAAQPVIGNDGKLAGAVAMGIDLQQWVSFSPIAGQPKGTIHDILTAEGVVIARSQDPDLWIGRNVASSEVHSRMLELKQGTAHALS